MPATDGTRRNDRHGEAPRRSTSAKWLVGSGIIGLAVGAFVLARRGRRAARSHSTRGLSQVDERDASSEQILQRLTRVRTADGQQAIRGTLIAEFAVGQRVTSAYVAFCPPFEIRPEVEVSVAGEDATVKVAQRLHNGVQLEVTLPEPAEEPFSVEVEFAAIESDAS